MRRAVAVGVYALALVLLAVFVVGPFLDKKRDIPAEVPSPPPLTAIDLVLLKAGSRLCMSDVGISAESRQMRFKAGNYGKPGPPLAVTLKAPGYSASATVPAGWPDNSALSVAVPAPPGSRLVTVCFRNRGTTKLAFYAASDRSRSRVRVVVDGKPVVATPTLAFAEAKPVSLAERAGVTAGRIAVFRGLLDHAWIVWAIALAMLVGVPVLVGLGLGASESQPRSDSSTG